MLITLEEPGCPKGARSGDSLKLRVRDRWFAKLVCQQGTGCIIAMRGRSGLSSGPTLRRRPARLGDVVRQERGIGADRLGVLCWKECDRTDRCKDWSEKEYENHEN
jgi:hypothetical protein